MGRPKKEYECSKCHRVGTVERNSVTYQSSYPVDVIRIPKLEDAAESIPAAWDYASKVCLHMSRMVLRFPPPLETDAQFAHPIYDHFMTVTTHTTIEIDAFEFLHNKLIEQRVEKSKELVAQEQKQQEEKSCRFSDYSQLSFSNSEDKAKKSRHTPLPPDTGRITRLSLAFLYGAIVCKVISNRTYIEKKSVTEGLSEHEKTAARAICTHYKMFYVDERSRKDLASWIEIMIDKRKMLLGDVIKKHQTITPNGKKAKLNRNHVRKMEQEIDQRVQDMIAYLPIFERLFSRFGQSVRSDPYSAAFFLMEFKKAQVSIYDQQTTYHFDRVVHGKDDYCNISPDKPLRIVGVRRGNKRAGEDKQAT